MKIFRVTPILYPYFVGGLSIHCHELSNHQSTYGHDVTVLTVERGKKIENVSYNYNLKMFRWFKMPWDFVDMENPISPGLWWELLKSDFDILHAHSHLFFISLFSVIICKIKNKPCFVTVHGVRAVRNKATNLFQEIWIRIISRLIFKLTERIFCQTLVDAQEIKSYGVEEDKIEVIPNGIDTELFRPGNFNDNYILWVGRFVEEKGLKYLIDAYPGVKKKFPNTQVVLVGYGPLKKEIISKVEESGLSDIFEFKEKCSQQEIAKLMKNCELFVLPSLKEGFPKSLLEAMACGKPVITTDGLKEIVKNAGITVEPSNTEELEEAIKEMLSHPSDLKKVGLNGRRLVEQNWSWNCVSKRIEEFYSSALRKN